MDILRQSQKFSDVFRIPQTFSDILRRTQASSDFNSHHQSSSDILKSIINPQIFSDITTIFAFFYFCYLIFLPFPLQFPTVSFAFVNFSIFAICFISTFPSSIKIYTIYSLLSLLPLLISIIQFISAISSIN